MRNRIQSLALIPLLLLAGCASTPRCPTAGDLHAALERCKASNGAHEYAAVNVCFAEARRSLDAECRTAPPDVSAPLLLNGVSMPLTIARPLSPVKPHPALFLANSL